MNSQADTVTDTANAAQIPLGLYCHVPFCADTCDFCAFYQVKPRSADIAQFLDGIERELTLAPPNRAATTFFWGGGTPGILSPKALFRLGQSLLRANQNTAPVEWTVEMAPATVSRERLDVLRELGVTRISMGAQSFDAQTLAAMGRWYLPSQIFRAWELIQAAGFPDTSLDLIFAIPGQGESRWQSDLENAVRLSPHHISTYCLTFEEDTALYIKLSQGCVKCDAEQEAALYRATWAFLETHGYAQYEISNFARPNHACLHNLNTWRMAEWIGYGPAAASQWGAQRFQNPPDLTRWLHGIGRGELVREQVVALTPALLLQDALMFGLRMNEGVAPDALAARFGISFPNATRKLGEKLANAGLLLIENTAKNEKDRWRLTLEGRLRADAIAVALLETF